MIWVSSALASGLLWGGGSYAELDTIDVDVRVQGRIVTATTTYTFSDTDAGVHGFAAVIPDDAAVGGLRIRDGDSWLIAGATDAGEATPEATPDGAAGGVLPGSVFSVQLPDTEADVLEVELVWQQILVAAGGRLSVEVPLDDAGLNPSDPTVSLSFSVDGAEEVTEVVFDTDTSSGSLDSSDRRIDASWSGSVSDLDVARLSWSDAVPPFGLTTFTYRPQLDPFTGTEEDFGYGIVLLQPGEPDPSARVDQLFTFVLDSSESMRGRPLAAASKAGKRWIGSLRERDRFNVVPYTSQALPWRANAPRATDANVERARDFLDRQEAVGLSDPEEGLVTALRLADDTVQGRTFFGCGGRVADDAPVLGGQVEPTGEILRTAPYVVLLTDGSASTGETDVNGITASVRAANTVGASVFAIGVGEADRLLLDQLTAQNRGEAAYVDRPEAVGDAVDALRDRIADPLLVRPSVYLEGMSDPAPAALPDVTAGHEVLLAFRFAGSGETEVRLRGIRGQEDIDDTFPLVLPDNETELPVVARLWAQLRLRDLEARYDAGETHLYDAIYELVDTYGVASDVVTLAFGDRSESDEATVQSFAIDDSGGSACSCATPRLLAGGLPVGLALLLAGTRRRRP